MKQLYLLRHAKSSWDDPGIDDFDRPLNKRGRRAAAIISDFVRANQLRPAAVLCSPAKRTRQTLELMSSALGDDMPVTFDMRLYEATRQTLLARLTELSADLPSVLLVGHNPGLQRLALHLLSSTDSSPAVVQMQEKYPTGALAVLSAKIDAWSNLAGGTCTLDRFLRPSDMEGAE